VTSPDDPDCRKKKVDSVRREGLRSGKWWANRTTHTCQEKADLPSGRIQERGKGLRCPELQSFTVKLLRLAFPERKKQFSAWGGKGCSVREGGDSLRKGGCRADRIFSIGKVSSCALRKSHPRWEGEMEENLLKRANN